VTPAPSVPASHAFDMARRQQAIAAAAAQKNAQAEASKPDAAKTTATAAGAQFKNVGRNDVCPCGSGKKFKNCHGA
jgi:preprotein translocase subunit SecA